ncbi:MAG: (deoxy)nucleoside triphosphate pyrophosphohydrolase [Bacteroidales bacterium]
MIEVTCAIIIKDEKVLVTQRSERMTHPLQWEFPGGKLKPGESPERCIIREIREELHARISVEQVLPSVVHDYGSFTVKLIPFICVMDSDEIILQQHGAYKWIQKNELAGFRLLEADRKLVKSINGYLH